MNVAKAAFFDGQVSAPWAATEYGEDEAPKIRRLLTEAHIRDGLRLLEPGCGTGRLTEILAGAVGPSGRVDALEISPLMVEASRKRVAHRRNVRVHQVALEDYRDSGQGFDRIVCHQVFPHFDHKPAAVKRLADLLRPDGLVVIVHFINFAEINDVHRLSPPLYQVSPGSPESPPNLRVHGSTRPGDMKMVWPERRHGAFTRSIRVVLSYSHSCYRSTTMLGAE
jgi:demethylmenaquinone methyltransferase/2-methoxy-6-polyprenyl-1,4-benzoquinol methylase